MGHMPKWHFESEQKHDHQPSNLEPPNFPTKPYMGHSCREDGLWTMIHKCFFGNKLTQEQMLAISLWICRTQPLPIPHGNSFSKALEMPNILANCSLEGKSSQTYPIIWQTWHISEMKMSLNDFRRDSCFHGPMLACWSHSQRCVPIGWLLQSALRNAASYFIYFWKWNRTKNHPR